MAATQGCGVLKGKYQVVSPAGTAKLRTQGNVIDEQSTRKGLFYTKLVQPLGVINHPVIASVHFISVCHGKDQLPLESKYLLNRRNAREREVRTGRFEPPTRLGFPVAGKGIHVSSPE